MNTNSLNSIINQGFTLMKEFMYCQIRNKLDVTELAAVITLDDYLFVNNAGRC